MRRIAWVFAVAVLMASCAHNRPMLPQMTQASAPPGLDAPGARWYKLAGANGRTFLTAVLTPEGPVDLKSDHGGRLILAAGKPLREPVAKYGPFVMNTEGELRQAFADYQAGRF